MKGLVLTRRNGEQILFMDEHGEVIGVLTVVSAEWNRVSMQLDFVKRVRMERKQPEKGRKVNRYA
jgi:sRNA-binding carbon storage regulator CsrA